MRPTGWRPPFGTELNIAVHETWKMMPWRRGTVIFDLPRRVSDDARSAEGKLLMMMEPLWPRKPESAPMGLRALQAPGLVAPRLPCCSAQLRKV